MRRQSLFETTQYDYDCLSSIKDGVSFVAQLGKHAVKSLDVQSVIFNQKDSIAAINLQLQVFLLNFSYL